MKPEAPDDPPLSVGERVEHVASPQAADEGAPAAHATNVFEATSQAFADARAALDVRGQESPSSHPSSSVGHEEPTSDEIQDARATLDLRGPRAPHAPFERAVEAHYVADTPFSPEANQPPVQPSNAPPRPFIVTTRQWLYDYFLGDDPTFGLAFVPYAFLSMLLFTRHPMTNFIFDEQEALLANPYVRSIADAQPKFRWVDAFYRDFWGLGPDRSIGSYRPIPDLVWRALWGLGARDHGPFLHHVLNVMLHGVNGALVCGLVFHLTRRRATAWLAGACFTASAVLTEAVSGVVGIADVLGATGALMALMALVMRMPWMGIGVFFATLFGMYSKESALCCVPLVPVTALLTAQILHPEKPRRWARAAVALVAAAGAFVLYVEARRHMFPAPIPAELSADANAGKPFAARTFAAILRWYAQPSLPKDPLNNPLVSASGPYRFAGAMRVYFRGLVQLVFPYPLSGDYSAPQEPVPTNLFAVENVLGALALVLPFPAAAWLGIRAWTKWRRADAEMPSVDISADVTTAGAHSHGDPSTFSPSVTSRALRPIDRRPLIGVAMLWIVVSYIPVSNLPVLLPTVRAERFWYFPAIGSSLALAILFTTILDRWNRGTARIVAISALVAFFGFQAVAARLHANDYTDDLSFWDATRKAVPRSAKAHLNYSVMKGARGDLEARLAANRTALELAPQWPMASIYLGDTLCRLHRTAEAWPHYVRGFELAPNDVNLIALGLQCLWDEKAFEVPASPASPASPESPASPASPPSAIRSELDALKDKYPGSWVEYLGRDILEHGEEHGGVDPKYRPRGYNEGPKE